MKLFRWKFKSHESVWFSADGRFYWGTIERKVDYDGHEYIVNVHGSESRQKRVPRGKIERP